MKTKLTNLIAKGNSIIMLGFILIGGLIGWQGQNILTKTQSSIAYIPTLIGKLLTNFKALTLFSQSIIVAIAIVILFNLLIVVIRKCKNGKIALIDDLKKYFNENVSKHSYLVFKILVNLVSIVIIALCYITIFLAI